MTEKQFMNYVIEFLCEDKRVTKEVIQKHWIPESNRPSEISKIYKRLCDSAQNMQMAPNVVSKSIGGIENLDKVTNNFDVQYMVNTYGRDNYSSLFDDIKSILNPTGKLRTTPKSVWPKFCKAVIDSAYFLNKFESHEDFYNYADNLYNSKQTKNLLPFATSFEIRGIGVALACDFFKEIGFVNYGKPDVHLQDILIASKFLNPNLKNKIEGIYEVLNVIDNVAEKNNLTAFAVDKSIWLIGSGNYYKADFKTKNRKKEFIQRVENEYHH